MGIRCFGQTTVLVDEDIVVYFDPKNLSDRKKLPKADFILLSGCVFDEKSIALISGKKTKIISSPLLSKQIEIFKDIMLLAPLEESTILELKAIPAYQLQKIIAQDMHTYNGYVATISGKQYYFAGPTELTPEMNLIKADVAVLPVAGKTMDLLEALAATNVVDAKLFVPIAYADDEREGLIACKRFTLKCTSPSDISRPDSEVPELSGLHD